MIAKTSSELGFEKGFSIGFDEERRRLLLHLFERRFGRVSDFARMCIQHWPTEQLEVLADSPFAAQSLKELGLEGD